MHVLTSTPDARWLPPGGRADVVLAAPGDPLPEPTAMVRLLVTCGSRLLLAARSGGRPGLDLPTTVVRPGEEPGAALERLGTEVLGRSAPTALLGYVRNVVPRGAGDYPWPVPLAHFCVHHAEIDEGRTAGGTWLERDAAHADLAERHWWPLLGALPPSRAGGDHHPCSDGPSSR